MRGFDSPHLDLIFNNWIRPSMPGPDSHHLDSIPNSWVNFGSDSLGVWACFWAPGLDSFWFSTLLCDHWSWLSALGLKSNLNVWVWFWTPDVDFRNSHFVDFNSWIWGAFQRSCRWLFSQCFRVLGSPFNLQAGAHAPCFLRFFKKQI